MCRIVCQKVKNDMGKFSHIVFTIQEHPRRCYRRWFYHFCSTLHREMLANLLRYLVEQQTFQVFPDGPPPAFFVF